MTSSVKKATRPSKVNMQSISAKALQLWTGSGLFMHDTSMKERTTFFSKGTICLTINNSPKMPPEKSKNGRALQITGLRGGKRGKYESQYTKNTNSDQHINAIRT